MRSDCRVDSIAVQRHIDLISARIQLHVRGCRSGQIVGERRPRGRAAGRGQICNGVEHARIGRDVDRAGCPIRSHAVCRGGLGKISGNVVPEDAAVHGSKHVRRFGLVRLRRRFVLSTRRWPLGDRLDPPRWLQPVQHRPHGTASPKTRLHRKRLVAVPPNRPNKCTTRPA